MFHRICVTQLNVVLPREKVTTGLDLLWKELPVDRVNGAGDIIRYKEYHVDNKTTTFLFEQTFW